MNVYTAKGQVASLFTSAEERRYKKTKATKGDIYRVALRDVYEIAEQALKSA